MRCASRPGSTTKSASGNAAWIPISRAPGSSTQARVPQQHSLHVMSNCWYSTAQPWSPWPGSSAFRQERAREPNLSAFRPFPTANTPDTSRRDDLGTTLETCLRHRCRDLPSLRLGSSDNRPHRAPRCNREDPHLPRCESGWARNPEAPPATGAATGLLVLLINRLGNTPLGRVVERMRQGDGPVVGVNA